MKMSIQKDEVSRLQRIALGKEAADIILSGGTVLNVYTGELLWGCPPDMEKFVSV